MSDKVKYGSRRIISSYELEARPGLPSQIFREAEATLIGELARSVALSGKQFDGWPTVNLRNATGGYMDHMELIAEVVTK